MISLLKPEAVSLLFLLPPSLGEVGGHIDRLFYTILAVTGVLFLLVQGCLGIFLVRYRAKPGAKSHFIRGHAVLETVWTLIPALLLLFLVFYSLDVWQMAKTIQPETSQTLKVRVEAEQYAWNFIYPGPDGKFGTADDLKKTNQLNIPAGREVLLDMVSVPKDGTPAVIHSFFVPELRLKQDIVPGMTIAMGFKALRPGRFEIACAEFCGLGHYRMRGFLTVHSAEDYNAWLESEKAS